MQLIAPHSDSITEFAEARSWSKFHTPSNLLLALTGEVGELVEIFQWLGEEEGYDKEHVMMEMADCAIYVMRIGGVCGVDLV